MINLEFYIQQNVPKDIFQTMAQRNRNQAESDSIATWNK